MHQVVTSTQASTAPDGPRDAAAAAHVERLRQAVEDGLRTLALPVEPVELYDPIRYVLGGGGKRLRPVLLLLAAEAAGGSAEEALPAALAVEVFHNFTLVHDDIMDQAAERRGRPSVHVLWNESTAILAGDLMMGLSYDLLARTPVSEPASLLHTFHRMVAQVCEGQALDEAFERRPNVSVEDYLDMISRKTGALIVCVLELGGRIAGAPDAVVEALVRAGHELGRAFQIQDDLLDLTADHDGWGKAIGGDLVQGKKTFLLLRALEAASGEDHAWFDRIPREGGLAPDEVEEARQRMQGLGILEEAREAVARHSTAGISALDDLPATEARATMRWLAHQLASRAV